MDSKSQGVQPAIPDVRIFPVLLWSFSFLLLSGFPEYCLAQAGEVCTEKRWVVTSDSIPVQYSPDIDQAKPNKARLVTTIAAFSTAYIGSMAYLQFIWYHDHERVKFEFYNDLEGYNQIDKFGHTFGSYVESYIGYRSLRWAGIPEKKATIIGGSLGFFLQLPIEIWDGMYEGWGFSWSDVGANALGSGLVMVQQLAFQDQVVRMKSTYSHSPYADVANGYLGNGFDELFYDYNGHTFWLSTGLNRLIPWKKIPGWLNIAAGYSAGGMFGEFENLKSYHGVVIPETERYRQYLLSLDIDFGRIDVRNKFLKALLNNMFMVKIPFPAVEFNSKGQLRFHPLYF